MTFLHFAFYNKLDPKLVQSKMNKSQIAYGKILFTQGCIIIPSDNPYLSTTVYIASVGCKYKENPVSSITTYGGEEVAWNIYSK